MLGYRGIGEKKPEKVLMGEGLTQDKELSFWWNNVGPSECKGGQRTIVRPYIELDFAFQEYPESGNPQSPK